MTQADVKTYCNFCVLKFGAAKASENLKLVHYEGRDYLLCAADYREFKRFYPVGRKREKVG